MKFASRFQFWSLARVARALLLVQVVAGLSVLVAGQYIDARQSLSPSTHESDRSTPPGLPDRHHIPDAVV